MSTIKIVKDIASDLICGLNRAPYEIVEDTIVDRSRWTLQHRLIIKDTSTGKFYERNYDEGATEYQDVDEPFGYGAGDEVEFHQVLPKQVKVTVYEKIDSEEQS